MTVLLASVRCYAQQLALQTLLAHTVPENSQEERNRLAGAFDSCALAAPANNHSDQNQQ